jgi:hypothetical protein
MVPANNVSWFVAANNCGGARLLGGTDRHHNVGGQPTVTGTGSATCGARTLRSGPGSTGRYAARA